MKAGVLVPVYTEVRVSNIILDEAKKAIVEVKTGRLSELTVNQMINYNAATKGVGTLRGPQAKAAGIATTAPQTVYVLRDTEI